MSTLHLLNGPYTLKGHRLTFFVTDAAVALQCWDAQKSGADVTVTLTELEGTKDITGKIHSVELLSTGIRSNWRVVMRVSAHSG
ncbi:MAG TPA: hypothetical protein VK629_06590 [Steroidobacteraceae bacterium]|nr:hypothetical protein [Steroidobacteraceae bacterium]